MLTSNSPKSGRAICSRNPTLELVRTRPNSKVGAFQEPPFNAAERADGWSAVTLLNSRPDLYNRERFLLDLVKLNKDRFSAWAASGHDVGRDLFLCPAPGDLVVDSTFDQRQLNRRAWQLKRDRSAAVVGHYEDLVFHPIGAVVVPEARTGFWQRDPNIKLHVCWHLVGINLLPKARSPADSLDQLDRDRQTARDENQRLSHALEAAQAASSEARAAFTSDLKIVRDALATAEERARSAEQRALLEIDQERQRGARALKRLEAERDGHAAKLAEQEARIKAGGVQLDAAQRQIAGLESSLAAAKSQVLAQSKAMTEIFGRMDALQEAITAGPARPDQKTSGKARRKTAQAKSPRTRAAKTTR